jgi:hypothetical protein
MAQSQPPTANLPGAFLGLVGAVLGANTALGAAGDINECWTHTAKNTNSGNSFGETESTLCFSPNGKYTWFAKTCFEWQLKSNVPCEVWGGKLSYRRNGKFVELQNPSTYGAGSPSYCKQDISDFDRKKFVACFMPGVEWTKRPAILKEK